ncbi:MAG: ADP-ribosylglycohydrolase family protein [Oscillospiraceae bacterium]|nr:ADP-ribosylglycohydrolase family protein [Oscillospiraceae bacterium]
MRTNLSAYRGCLLGLAVGDAMGLTVNKKTLAQIREDYGPAGLLGYDLVNGFADISSHTQIAAYSANGLLLGLTHGQGATAYPRYIAQALKEWAKIQHLPGDPMRRSCWLSHVRQLRQRHCMDARTLDALTRDVLGSPEKPSNQADGAGTLCAAVPVGLFFYPERMEVQQIGLLGTQTVALTHGHPLAFLSGAVLSYVIAGIIQDEESSMEQHFCHGAEAVAAQFGEEYPQARELRTLLEQAVALAKRPELAHWQVMEQLGCNSCAQVLAGAMYAVLASHGDFDSAMIIAVNHSGKSAAVGAVTGAVLGAAMGEEALPEFYLECLEPVGVLRELATDLYNGCPKEWRVRLFDDDWDKKYTQGQPVERSGWAEG